METGFRHDMETGKPVPAHFIQLLTVKHNEKTVIECDWSRAVSKNPYFSFMFDGASIGDKVELSWFDTRGESDSVSTIIE